MLIWQTITHAMGSREMRKRRSRSRSRTYVRIVGEGLRKLMGGVKFCREKKLTRDMLLELQP